MSTPHPSSPKSPSSPSHSPFAHLSPVLSSRSQRPPLNDGCDNFPCPLPSDALGLGRRLTGDPDVERQMALSIDGVGPPPEGGLEAWACVSGAFFILFCIFGFISSFGQLEVYYLQHQLSQYSKSEVAWISSVQTTLTFAGSMFSGRYFDSHGARLLIVVGTSLSVGALIGIAFCHSYWQFMLAHAAYGLSGSLLYSPATAVAGHWFMKRRSTAVGVVVCGSGLAGVIYPIALKQLTDKLNFRDALLIIAGMNAALMFPSWWTMKARLPPRIPPPLKSLLGPWTETRYSCFVIGSSLIMINWLSPYLNAPILASSNNLSDTLSAYSIAILQAGSFFGRVLSGFLADRLGVWNMFVSSGLVSAISLFAFWTASPLPAPAVVVGLVAYGFGSGAWISLVAATCGAISPTREYGMRLGMLWSLGAVGILAGPVVCGVLVSADDQKFGYAAIFCGLTTLIGIVITVLPVITSAATCMYRRGSGAMK